MFDKNKIEFFIFLILVKVFRSFGIKNARCIVTPIAWLLWYVIPIRKNVVLKNLQIAFPDDPKSTILAIAKKHYKSMIYTFAEIANIQKLDEIKILDMVDCKNFHLLEEKAELKKGVFLLTAHYGNWELGALYFGIKLKNGLKVLAKSQRNRLVSNWLKNMREKFENKEIRLGLGVKAILSAIRAKEIVGIVGDQRGPKNGLRINFFGRQTATYVGTAKMAVKTGAPILVVFFKRNQYNNFECELTEIDYSQYSNNLDDAVEEVNQEYMKLLEKQIMDCPEQWFWMHNIWKY